MAMRIRYGELPNYQIQEFKKSLRSAIFFVLLCVDPNTAAEHSDIDVNQLFDNLLLKIGGYNALMNYPKEIIEVMSLLEAARLEYNKEQFNFAVCRKLILDAGAEVNRIKEDGVADTE